MVLWRCLLVSISTLVTSSVLAESYTSIQTRKSDLFHPETGFRIDRQRAPVPDDIPLPAKKIELQKVVHLSDRGAILLDVFGALQSRYDELDGTWLVGKKRKSIPGAVWLPEVGRGVLQPDISKYLVSNLEKVTGGDFAKPIVVFCVSDCWMSWNAAQRIAKLGYGNVSWFPLGTDGWLESGRELQRVDPVPVDTE